MKLSIITVVYNNLQGIKRTSDSILPLPDSAEWIIIDGESSDGTTEYLITLPTCENIKFVSETDQGIFDAMNKGILLATGQYLIFMNSGDFFNRKELLNLLNYDLPSSNDILVYNYLPLNTQLESGYARSLKNITYICEYDCIPHQSTLIRKELFDKLGKYDLSYRYAGDYDFFMRAFNAGYTIIFLNHIFLSYFVQDGVSSNLHLSLRHWEENKRIQLKYCGRYSKKLMLIFYIKRILSILPFHTVLERLLRECFFKKRSNQGRKNAL